MKDREQIKELFHEAVDLAPDERRRFLDGNCEDAETRLEIENLLRAFDEAGEFIASPALVDLGLVEEKPEENRIGEKIGHYEIVREIGRGGMGAVYLATRAGDEFEREVALKIVKRGMDTDFIVRRFRHERQILASLNHPNIARLFEGGTTQDGLPYFVMEFVDGQDLISFCAEKKMSLEERLELFRQVCSAVAYAHQNLVIHRDLKPSNILVTPDGTPKLLDFGIAKLLNPDSADGDGSDDKTTGVLRLLTPEYASPEQIRGEKITTVSDVYSLGVILYQLLTGQSPYRTKSKSYNEIIDSVCKNEPVAPSSAISKWSLVEDTSENKQTTAEESKTDPQSAIRNPKPLRGDIDNIVIKALQKETARRYASVQEFSEDIRRHLAGLPVTAQADTFGYRAAKFVKRHRAGVLAGLLIFLSLIGGVAVASWQAYRANAERLKAEQRFNQVRKLANTVLFDYHDGIEKLAGSTPIREKMVRDALEYLDNLSAEGIDDAGLQREVASAYQKVGDVQGGLAKANLGDSAGALESYKKALTIREKLLAAFPQDDKLKHELARSYMLIGSLLHPMDNLPAALEHFQKGFALFETIQDRNLEVRRDLSSLYKRFAEVLKDSGKITESIENHQRAIADTAKLIEEYPNDNELKRDLVVSNVLLGDALQETGNLEESLESYRRAYNLAVPLLAPANAQSRRDVNLTHTRVAFALRKLEKFEESLKIELEVLAADEELLKADPSNAIARRDVMLDLNKIARLHSSLGDFGTALKNQQKSLAMCEAEVKTNPANTEVKMDLSIAHYWLADILEKSKNLNDALANYQKALAIEEEISNADPTNAELRANLAESNIKISDLRLKLGDWESALKGFHKAVKMFEELIALDKENASNAASLALVYDSLGAYHSSTANAAKKPENLQEAAKFYRQSLEIWNQLKESGKLLPEHAKKPDEIKQLLEKCEADLAKAQKY